MKLRGKDLKDLLIIKNGDIKFYDPIEKEELDWIVGEFKHEPEYYLKQISDDRIFIIERLKNVPKRVVIW